jgi:hypothetical protein
MLGWKLSGAILAATSPCNPRVAFVQMNLATAVWFVLWKDLAKLKKWNPQVHMTAFITFS